MEYFCDIINCKIIFEKAFFKRMTFAYSNSLTVFWHFCLISFKQFFKKLKVIEEFINPECFCMSLKTLILKNIVFFLMPNLLINVINFSLSQNRLNIFPWWYATVIITFLFVRRISSYSLMILAASWVYPLFRVFRSAVLFQLCQY